MTKEKRRGMRRSSEGKEVEEEEVLEEKEVEEEGGALSLQLLLLQKHTSICSPPIVTSTQPSGVSICVAWQLSTVIPPEQLRKKGKKCITCQSKNVENL